MPAGSSTYKNVGTTSEISWMSQQNVNSTVDGPLTTHKLILDFNKLAVIGPLPYIGIYDAFRHYAQTIEPFKLILCYFNEPANQYDTPGDSDDKFEFDISVPGTQTVVHEFTHYSLAGNLQECGSYYH